MTESTLFGWYTTARWLGYLAVFLVGGAAVVRWWILPRVARATGSDLDAAAARATRIARIWTVLLALGLLAKLYLQTRSLLEPDEAVTPDLLMLVVGTQWGKGWLAQATAVLLALVGWRLAGRSGGVTGRALAIAGSAALVVASPLTGHATGLPAAGALGYPLTVLHLAAGTVWIGTLGVLWLAALRRSGRDPGVPVAALVEAFSPLALAAGIAVMALGGLIAWRYIGSWSALFASDYGRTLLVKILALGGVAGVGAWNWRVALPKLRRGQPAGIVRSAAVELAVGLLLLAITAVLVARAAPVGHE